MIDLYAITDDPAPPLPKVASLRSVASHGLALVCAPASEAELSPEVLWRHEEVVETLMEDRDLLPVRFGTRLDDESAAARVLSERYQELAIALDRVRGAVELSLRVLWEPEDESALEPVSRTGAEYLRTRQLAASTKEGVLRAIHNPLAARARASTRRGSRDANEVLRAAYLVDRDAVESFVARVAELEEDNPRARLLCTGPWPPYSFTRQ